jgi:hypothetical protein
MTRLREERTEERRPAADPPTPTAPTPVQAILTLQQRAGNAAVARYLEDAPTQAGPAGPAAADPAQAAAEAEATETQRRLRDAQLHMLTSTNLTVQNTALLFEGSPSRLRYTPMTLRSDSEQIRADRGEAPGSRAYYFKGLTQKPRPAAKTTIPPDTERFAPNTVGTIDGDTIVVRGKDSSGSWRSEEDIKGTFVHEASHILVASYGQHPNSPTDASSFDRYKDEFRAYFVEQFGPYAKLDPDDRAKAIKRHLVGDSLTDTRGYEDLRKAYWTGNPNAFSAQVDAHKRPDGFNLTNSPRLDRLFALLGDAATDPAKVDDVMVAILRLMPAERGEAKGSTLIRQRSQALGADADKRVRAALDAPLQPAYTGELNPSNSPRIARLHEQLTRNDEAEIKTAYDKLTPEERGHIYLHAPTLVFVDHNVLDPRMRACVYAMLVGGTSRQYDAMADFLEACFVEFMSTAVPEEGAAPPAGPSAELRAALRRVSFSGRLALFRMVEDARHRYVEILPEPVRIPILQALRGDRDP